nr:unnamed protein product [Callosobruchus analis]
MSPRFKLLNKLQFTLQKVFKRKPQVPAVEKNVSVPKELDAGAFLKEKPKATSLPKEKIRLVDVKEKTTAEIECLAYESEEQLCAITERERDASVVLTSTGLSVSLAKSRKSDVGPCIPQQKQIKGVPKPKGSIPPDKAGSQSGGDISGPTKSAHGRPVRGEPGEMLDKEVEDYEAMWSKGRKDSHRILNEQIDDEWVQKEVLGALSPELHEKIINISIDNMVAELERNKPKDG